MAKEVLITEKMRRIVTININGLREENNILHLGRMLYTLKIGICIVTETHLRKEELK